MPFKKLFAGRCDVRHNQKSEKTAIRSGGRKVHKSLAEITIYKWLLLVPVQKKMPGTGSAGHWEFSQF